MTTLKIKVTHDVLVKSQFCSVDTTGNKVGENCAIALAVRDIFPDALVGTTEIAPYGWKQSEHIQLPIEAMRFIRDFDVAPPQKRVKMNPIEFEVSVPESIIEKINIDELRPLLENHPTLELDELLLTKRNLVV